jgi:hypothetical protein
MQARNGRLIRRLIPVVTNHRGDTAAWLARAVGIISIGAYRARLGVTAQVAERAIEAAGRLRSAAPGQCSRSGAYSGPAFRQWREPADYGQAVRANREAKSTGDRLPRSHRWRIPFRQIVGKAHTGIGQQAQQVLPACSQTRQRQIVPGPSREALMEAATPALAPGDSRMSYRERNFGGGGCAPWISRVSPKRHLGPSSRAMA